MDAVDRRRKAMTAVLLAGLMAAPTAVAAGKKWCFEDIGCPADRTISRAALKKLSCDNLRHVRNAIYDQNGYCFRDQALAQLYDNSDCVYASSSAVPLNRHERRNVKRIIAVERANSCK